MPKQISIFSNWNTMIEGLELSPKEFYKQLKQAIGDRLIPNIKKTPVIWEEGGVITEKCEPASHTKGVCYRYLHANFSNSSFCHYLV